MCDKVAYESRRKAKLQLRRHRGKGLSGAADMHVYACPYCPGWHIGHMPRVVREGFVPRARCR